MSKNSTKKTSLEIFFKSMFLTILALALVAIGFLGAGYFSGALV